MNMPPDDPHRTAEAIERLAVRIGQIEQALAELKSDLSALQVNRTEGEPEEVVRAAIVEAGEGDPAAATESVVLLVDDSACRRCGIIFISLPDVIAHTMRPSLVSVVYLFGR